MNQVKTDWYRILCLLIAKAKNEHIPQSWKNDLTTIKPVDIQEQIQDWQVKTSELQILENIKRSIDLVRNPNFTDRKEELKKLNPGAFLYSGNNLFSPLLTGLQEQFSSALSNKKKNQNKINKKHKGKFDSSPNSVRRSVHNLPSPESINNSNLWIAIGDETGNWDKPHNGIIGLTLMFAHAEDWETSVSDTVDAISVRERMASPLMNLPKDKVVKPFHHGKEAFPLLEKGQYDLTKASTTDSLTKELLGNLNWLANHTKLITLGLYGKSTDIWDRLGKSDDPARTLGHVYGLLSSMILPFIKREDFLLVCPDSRSEESELKTRVRSKSKDEFSRGNNRPHGDQRGLLSAITDIAKSSVVPLNIEDIENKFEAAVLDKTLLQDWPIPDDFLLFDNRARSGLSDLGATLMRLSVGKFKSSTKITQPENGWPNVRFYAIGEFD